MINIQVASLAGFCMGVRRAVNLTLEENRKYDGKLVTLGALIHNPQMLGLLERRGVHAIKQPEEGRDAKVIIRAHGVPPSMIDELKEKKADILDATCPHVSRIHKIIKRHKEADRGNDIIIIGDKGHAEVTGLEGCADNKAYVINSIEEINRLPDLKNPCVVSQTTQSVSEFKILRKRIEERHPEAKIHDTICRATENRQKEIIELSRKSDLTIVVGGKISANTQRLVSIAAEGGKAAIGVENEKDIGYEDIRGKKNILVAAGASTPNWMITRMVEHIQKLEYENRSFLFRWFIRLIEFASGAYLGLGLVTAMLSASVWMMSGTGFIGFIFPAIVFSYIVAMYTLNHLTNIEANQLQEIFKWDPVNRYRKIYYVIAGLALFSALGLSLSIGIGGFLFIAFLEIAGILYNTRIIPAFLAGRLGGRRIKDIPLSKDLGISFGWTSVMIILPLISGINPPVSPVNTIIMSALVAGIAFIHSLISDIQDVQKDMFVGKETIPIHLGRKRTWWVANSLSVFLFLAILTCVLTGVFSESGYPLLLLPVLSGILLLMHQKGKLPRLTNTQLGMDLSIGISSLFVITAHQFFFFIHSIFVLK